MKILVFSMATMMKDVSMGGSQRHLRELLFYFAEKGHEVTVLTNRRRDNDEPFQLCDGVTMLPVLRFKETFPIPYDTHPFHLAHSYELVRRYAKEHDVFYIHDAQMDYGYLHAGIPTVASIKNFIYPEALISAFHTNRDRLIVACDYTYRAVKSTVGRVLPHLTDILTVVKNGIDLQIYRPVPSDWRERLGLAEEDFVVLFPHRPDISKGIYETVQVVQRLQTELPQRVRLLMPRHFDANVSQGTADFYHELEQQLPDTLVYYPWLPGHEMPAIYSAADVTLCIGHFIEAFGYVQIESIACGTPVVVSNVGAQRSIVPDGYFLEKVDYGDIEAAVQAVHKLRQQPVDVARVHQLLADTYSYEANLAGYEQLITSCVPYEGDLSAPKPTEARYELAPWCYVAERGIYHDYLHTYTEQDALYEFLKTAGQFTAAEFPLGAAALERAVLNGIIVPIIE